MSARQAYPAMPPKLDAKCEGCDVAYRRITTGFRGAKIIIRHRLRLVRVWTTNRMGTPVPGSLARLCDKCRKLNRTGRLP